ncbi:MAG: hypothetical protein VXW31_07560, partial [Planctomycetota bacterium]|nr:hypothetical protein [Planctomycetota bacterium]
DGEGVTPLHMALRPWEGEPDVELICKMLTTSGALVNLAEDGLKAHGERQKRIVKGLKSAVRSPGFLEDLANTLAGIDALGCAEGSGAMLKALLRQLDAFAGNAGDEGEGEPEEPGRAPKRHRLGDAYMERRGRHRLAVVRAVESAEFLSELADGLAGVNLFESDAGATKGLVAAAGTLDALG